MSNPTNDWLDDDLIEDALRDPTRSRLSETLRERPVAHRKIWVLSGGGAKGDFEVGAMTYLAARLDRYRPTAVCGTSVGGVNAVAAAEATEAGLTKMLDSWLTLATAKDMFEKAPWIAEAEALESLDGIKLEDLLSPSGGQLELYDNWDRTGQFFGSLLAPGIFGLLANDKAEQFEKDLNRLMELVREARSVYTLGPIRSKLQASVDVAAIRRARTLLRLVCVSLETGYPAWVTESGSLVTVTPYGRLEQAIKGADARAVLIDGVLASAAIPGVFPPIDLETNEAPLGAPARWRRNTYVDGGLRDVLPLRAAYDLIDHDWAWQEPPAIIAISASQAGNMHPRMAGDLERETPSFVDSNFVSIASRGVDICVDEVHANELDPSRLRPDVPVTFITPTFTVHDTTVVDPGLIQVALAYGYMRAFDELDPNVLANRPDASGSYDRVVTARALSDRITEIRLECFRLENRVRIVVGPTTQWEPAEIRRLRDLKRRIRSLVEQRIRMFGRPSVPEELSNHAVGNVNVLADWWQQFERHEQGTGPDPHSWSTTAPFHRYSTPWQPLYLWGGGEIAAETPPPAL